MRKVNVFINPRDTLPFKRLAGFHEGHKPGFFWALAKRLLMALQTDFARRDGGMICHLDPDMAIRTRYFQLGDMKLVLEFNRLFHPLRRVAADE
jgi:hypothetical protein